jgi:hypothetical protein
VDPSPKKAGPLGILPLDRAPESAEEFLKNFEKSGLPFELTEDEGSESSEEEETRENSKPDLWNKEISELNSELYFKLNYFSDKSEHTVEMAQVGYMPYSLEDEPEYVFFFFLRTINLQIKFRIFFF